MLISHEPYALNGGKSNVLLWRTIIRNKTLGSNVMSHKTGLLQTK